MSPSFADRAEALTAQVTSGPAALDRSVREAAAAGAPIAGPAGAYAAKVWRHAYRILDDDIDALRDVGYSDAEIFELTEAAAHGAARLRLRAALAALEADGGG